MKDDFAHIQRILTQIVPYSLEAYAKENPKHQPYRLLINLMYDNSILVIIPSPSFDTRQWYGSRVKKQLIVTSLSGRVWTEAKYQTGQYSRFVDDDIPKKWKSSLIVEQRSALIIEPI